MAHPLWSAAHGSGTGGSEEGAGPLRLLVVSVSGLDLGKLGQAGLCCALELCPGTAVHSCEERVRVCQCACREGPRSCCVGANDITAEPTEMAVSWTVPWGCMADARHAVSDSAPLLLSTL